MRTTLRWLFFAVLVMLIHGYFAEDSASRAQAPAGLLVVDLTVKDADQFQTYGAKSRPIVAAYNGTPVFRATNPTVLVGANPHKALIGFRFPSKAAIKDFYRSAEYQALIPLRTAAADATFTAYDIAQEEPSGDSRALLAVNLTVKDSARFGEYGSASRPVVQAHGGKLLLRAINPEVLSGEQRHQVLVLFKFPDQRVIRDFYSSEAYQKLIPLRTAGADVVFTAYDL